MSVIVLWTAAATLPTQALRAQVGAAHDSLNAGQIAAIDRFVGSELERQRIPGLALGIYDRGRILLAKGYGLANVELSVPVRPETIFQSGSTGKQFVSVAVMMLAEEHKLSLDDSIAGYFPDSPVTWKPILIRNLLSHTSGLSEYVSEERTARNGEFYMRLDFTEEELLRKVEALPIEWPAGSKWDYRNTNYLLLGYVIHKVTGKPYIEFLRERIFMPLGMTSTRLISERDIIMNRSSGYELEDGRLRNQQWVSPTFNSTADGALYFNVVDLARWDGALYTHRLLSEPSLERIWSVYRLNDGKPNWAGYGFGWFVGRQNGYKVLSHGGAWQGFTCEISRYPDENLGIAVLTNLDSDHSDPALVARVIAGLLRPPLMPRKLAPIADSKPQVAKLLRGALDRLIAGEEIRPRVDPDGIRDLGHDEAEAVMAPPPLQSLRRTLADAWPGGSMSLVRRAPLSGSARAELSVFRVSKGSHALLILIAPAPQESIALFAVMQDRPYE
ncbi:MAG: beta-lactamase family protein [Gammaproteobacteria bacterium]|nr:beta-lactamase family protein [Gammaproteobacteria bacterium]